MCGIAGIFGPLYINPFPLTALKHRGPDAEGRWTDPNNKIWLGHTRLSILDLSEKGHQPMACVDGRYQIVFNGEIYNFLELKEELVNKGYRFRSDSDTEIIPAAYDCWGIECLHRFNGMWAFALWDRVRRELWLSRDRFGKKPLYYQQVAEDFIFSSEVKAIHRWLGKDAELDSDVIRSICAGKFEWHGTDRTYLRGVKSLPAGHWLVKSPKDVKVGRWYQLFPKRIQVPTNLEDQATELRELIVDACRIRLRSDVPIATCLSGGVDSSSVTAVIHRGLPLKDERTATDFHRVFCAAFPNTILDETNAASSLALSLGTDLAVCEVVPPTPDRLMEAIASCDGPMHALAFYPIWELYGKIAETGIKVTMDGQGPDEMMGGYIETVRSGLQTALLQGNLHWFRDLLRIYGRLGENRYRSSEAFVWSELVRLAKLPLSRLKHLILRHTLQEGKSSEPVFTFAQPMPRGLDPFKQELYRQFCQTQLPTIIQQYDRCSMAHGVECRMPFMDYRIVEFVFSLPNESRVGDGFTKRALRKAVEGLVPDRNRLKKIKIGFNAPMVEWFTGPLREFMLDTMGTAEFKQTQYFDGSTLGTQFERWLSNPKWDSAWGFWPPVHFILWKDQISSSKNLFSPIELATCEVVA
jgi:asparagine synthase (glutamine-hydrolysing)